MKISKKLFRMKIVDNDTGQRIVDNKFTSEQEFKKLAKQIGKKIK